MPGSMGGAKGGKSISIGNIGNSGIGTGSGMTSGGNNQSGIMIGGKIHSGGPGAIGNGNCSISSGKNKGPGIKSLGPGPGAILVVGANVGDGFGA